MSINPTQEEITHKLIEILSAAISRPVSEIDINASFSKYGMDSMAFVAVSAELADWLDMEIEPSFGWDYPNIALFSAYLATELEGRDSTAASAQGIVQSR